MSDGFDGGAADGGRAGQSVLLIEIGDLEGLTRRERDAFGAFLTFDVHFLGEDTGVALGFGGFKIEGLATAGFHSERNFVALVGRVGVVVGDLNDDTVARIDAADGLDVGLRDTTAAGVAEVIANGGDLAVVVGGLEALT